MKTHELLNPAWSCVQSFLLPGGELSADDSLYTFIQSALTRLTWIVLDLSLRKQKSVWSFHSTIPNGPLPLGSIMSLGILKIAFLELQHCLNFNSNGSKRFRDMYVDPYYCYCLRYWQLWSEQLANGYGNVKQYAKRPLPIFFTRISQICYQFIFVLCDAILLHQILATHRMN